MKATIISVRRSLWEFLLGTSLQKRVAQKVFAVGPEERSAATHLRRMGWTTVWERAFSSWNTSEATSIDSGLLICCFRDNLWSFPNSVAPYGWTLFSNPVAGIRPSETYRHGSDLDILLCVKCPNSSFMCCYNKYFTPPPGHGKGLFQSVSKDSWKEFMNQRGATETQNWQYLPDWSNNFSWPWTGGDVKMPQVGWVV